MLPRDQVGHVAWPAAKKEERTSKQSVHLALLLPPPKCFLPCALPFSGLDRLLELSRDFIHFVHWLLSFALSFSTAQFLGPSSRFAIKWPNDEPFLLVNKLLLCSFRSHGFYEVVKHVLAELDSSPPTSRAALTTIQIGCFIRHQSL